jgi:hypothetical protein
MSDKLEKLYEKYNILSDAKDKVSQVSTTVYIYNFKYVVIIILAFERVR